MTREEILHELKTIGFRADPIDTVENGQMKHGIVFYGRKWESKTKYIDEELETVNANNTPIKNYINYLAVWLVYGDATDFSAICDREYIRHHIYVGLRRESENIYIAKAPCILDGIEKNIFVKAVETSNESVRKFLEERELDWLGMSQEEAFRVAQANVDAESMTFTINDFLNDEIKRSLSACLGGLPEEEMDLFLKSLYVVTTRDMRFGAAAIFNDSLMHQIAAKLQTDKLAILPSSINECLVLDARDFRFDFESLSGMVKSINREVVAFEDQLSDRVYTMLIPRTEEIM